MKKMTMWGQHLRVGSEEKKDFEDYVRNSSSLMQRLKEILDAYDNEIYLAESGGGNYDNDWSHLQAHRNGSKEILRKLRKLTQHLED